VGTAKTPTTLRRCADQARRNRGRIRVGGSEFSCWGLAFASLIVALLRRWVAFEHRGLFCPSCRRFGEGLPGRLGCLRQIAAPTTAMIARWPVDMRTSSARRLLERVL
jgi:hypothetical protein